MNSLKRFRTSPLKSANFKQIASILLLALALPVFIWGIVTLNFNYKNRAATGEPGVCMARNKTITVTPDGTAGTCHNIQTAVNAVTGSGFTISIKPGFYTPTGTINVSNKVNLKITGDSRLNNIATINFVPNGWGFKFDNTTGSIERLTIQGGSSNGMLSIQNTNNFAARNLIVSSNSSHTVDIQNSSNVTFEQNEVQSSAGAVEVEQSNNIKIHGNRIHNSNTAISIRTSSTVSVLGNLVYNNRENGLTINGYFSGVQNLKVLRNTFTKNGYGNGSATINLVGPTGANLEFSNNIVSEGAGPGIKSDQGMSFIPFTRNDIFGNNPNYSGHTSHTGINGNISADPQLHSAKYCPLSTSPVIYSRNPLQFMGAVRPCSGSPNPSSTPQPSGSASPSGSAIPTSSPTALPSPTSLPTCRPRPICLDAEPPCMMPITEDMCTPSPSATPTPTASPEPKLGDINGDGLVNIVDIGIIIDNYRIVPVPNPKADINNDGIANVVDIGIVIDNYGN